MIHCRDLNSRAAGLTDAEFVRLRDSIRSLEGIAGYEAITLTLTGIGEPERVSSATSSADLFSTLGPQMALGRSFTKDEEVNGKNQVVVLSHQAWQKKFKSNPNVIGQSVDLNEQSYTIIGVLPKDFKSPLEFGNAGRIELWIPIGYDGAGPNPGSHHLNVIGRLREGTTFDKCQSEIDTILAGLIKDYPKYYDYAANKLPQIVAISLQQQIVGDYRKPLLILLAAVGFVLLIACTNVANLLLTRNEARTREIAIRTALGASRARLMRQLIVESTLLGLIGGCVGILLAFNWFKILACSWF